MDSMNRARALEAIKTCIEILEKKLPNLTQKERGYLEEFLAMESKLRSRMS